MFRLHARVLWPLLLLALVSAHGAWAGPPTDQLHDWVDRMFTILRDPELRGDTQINQRRAAMTKVAGEVLGTPDAVGCPAVPAVLAVRCSPATGARGSSSGRSPLVKSS
jgi:hypothetical protein